MLRNERCIPLVSSLCATATWLQYAKMWYVTNLSTMGHGHVESGERGLRPVQYISTKHSTQAVAASFAKTKYGTYKSRPSPLTRPSHAPDTHAIASPAEQSLNLLELLNCTRRPAADCLVLIAPHRFGLSVPVPGTCGSTSSMVCSNSSGKSSRCNVAGQIALRTGLVRSALPGPVGRSQLEPLL